MQIKFAQPLATKFRDGLACAVAKAILQKLSFASSAEVVVRDQCSQRAGFATSSGPGLEVAWSSCGRSPAVAPPSSSGGVMMSQITPARRNAATMLMEMSQRFL
jgi:hypothetical protein